MFDEIFRNFASIAGKGPNKSKTNNDVENLTELKINVICFLPPGTYNLRNENILFRVSSILVVFDNRPLSF